MKHLASNPFNLAVFILTLSRTSDSQKFAKSEYKTLGYKLHNTNTIQIQYNTNTNRMQIQMQ